MLMSKATARRATSSPMWPSPMMPRVLPDSSVMDCWSRGSAQSASVSAVCAGTSCLARASIRAKVCSATFCFSAPLEPMVHTGTPRSRAASRST